MVINCLGKGINFLEDCNMHANYNNKIIQVLYLDAFILQAVSQRNIRKDKFRKCRKSLNMDD